MVDVSETSHVRWDWNFAGKSTGLPQNCISESKRRAWPWERPSPKVWVFPKGNHQNLACFRVVSPTTQRAPHFETPPLVSCSTAVVFSWGRGGGAGGEREASQACNRLRQNGCCLESGRRGWAMDQGPSFDFQCFDFQCFDFRCQPSGAAGTGTGTGAGAAGAGAAGAGAVGAGGASARAEPVPPVPPPAS